MERRPGRWLPLHFSLGIILVGLTGRALIDKALAVEGGAPAVAHWAQLQSLLEMVGGVVAIGLGQGLTVLVAQCADPLRRLALLRASFVLGAAASSIVAVMLALFVLMVPGSLVLGGVAWELARFALLAGWLAVAPSLLQAHWLGLHFPGRVLLLSAVTISPLVLAAWSGRSFQSLLHIQVVVALVVAGVVVVSVFWRREGQNFASWRLPPQDRHALLSYLPVGLSIGLASPLSLVFVRGEVSDQLSWQAAGYMQAIWRSAEWVTACVAGVLAAYALPRFSAAMAKGPVVFMRQFRRASLVVMCMGGAFLVLLLIGQREVLALLYDRSFVLPAGTVALFYLGDWLRMGSWVILFALLAARATRWVAVGEFFSLPLFAALVLCWPDTVSLERAATLYLLTYAIYLGFNLCGLWWVFHRGAVPAP